MWRFPTATGGGFQTGIAGDFPTGISGDFVTVTGGGFHRNTQQLMVYRIALVFYAQLVPELRTIGTALLTGAGVVSIVVGLAARGTLGNLIDGFALVVSRTAQVDDSIRLYTAVGTISARIRAISLGFTHLTDSDGNEVIVPNSVMMGSAIVRIRPLPPSLATAPDDKRGAP